MNDPPKDSAAPTADDPIWSTYVHEATAWDEKMIETWTQSMDTLLVFAALFSAIVTSFLLYASSGLSPDNANISNVILTDILKQLSSNTTGILTIPPLSQDFVPDPHDILVIALMYASLACCLIAAGGALLAKLWMIEYQRVVSVVDEPGGAHYQALNRQKIYGGLRAWRFGPILASLPILLLMSLTLFYLALHELIRTSQQAIGYGLAVAFAASITFGFVSTVVAAFVPDCPYRTPFSRGIKLCFDVLLPKVDSPHTLSFTCIVFISAAVAGVLMVFVNNDCIVMLVVPATVQAAMFRYPPKIKGGGPFIIGPQTWLGTWTPFLLAIIISAAYFNTHRYLLLGVCFGASALWAFQAFVWAQCYSHDAETDEAEALAWLLQRRLSSQPALFETAKSIADTDHKKVILSRSLFPLIPRLKLSPTPQEKEICELEHYVSCIKALSDFQLRKATIWKNKAAVTVPEGWMKLADNLWGLISAIARLKSGSQSGPLADLCEKAEVALRQLREMLPEDSSEERQV